MDPHNVSPTADAIAALAPLVGAGGISGIVIAIFSYLKAARSGRRGEPDKVAAGIGIQALLADSGSITRAVTAIDGLAVSMAKLALIAEEGEQKLFEKIETYIDEVRKLRRAVEDLRSHHQRPGDQG